MGREQDLAQLLARLRRLRGTGPVQPEFYQWVADARTYLTAVYGDPSPQVAALNTIAFANTTPDDAYMHHDGPWGLFERISRIEELFNSLEPATA
ncbi:MAG: hypothetical protein WEB00_01915 [Dehalococcoidia bacterium]